MEATGLQEILESTYDRTRDEKIDLGCLSSMNILVLFFSKLINYS